MSKRILIIGFGDKITAKELEDLSQGKLKMIAESKVEINLDLVNTYFVGSGTFSIVSDSTDALVLKWSP
jgi:hypothetical protein